MRPKSGSVLMLLASILAPASVFAADRAGSPAPPAVSPTAVVSEPAPPPATLRFFNRDIVTHVRLRDQLRRPAVLSALNANVQDVFNEYGVQIMSPHYRGDPAAPVVVPKERWFEPPAARSGDPRRGT